MEPNDNLIMSIAVEEYNRLIKRSRKLEALENGGVDNWEWYGEAMSEYFNEE